MRRSSTVPLPKTLNTLVSGFALLCRLPRLHSVSVRELGIDVVRDIEEGDDVIPGSVLRVLSGAPPEVVDFEFALSHLEVESLVIEEHPLTKLRLAFDMISNRYLVPCCIWAPQGDWVAAFLGLQSDEMPPFLFGIPVHYLSAAQLEGKIVIVGGPGVTPELATFAVILDLGEVSQCP